GELPRGRHTEENAWGNTRKEAPILKKIRRLLAPMDESRRRASMVSGPAAACAARRCVPYVRPLVSARLRRVLPCHEVNHAQARIPPARCDSLGAFAHPARARRDALREESPAAAAARALSC